MSADDTRLKRLRFRAWRRGFREADLILGQFADAHARDLSAEDLARFEVLLDQPDHELYAWIMGAAAIPPAFDHELMTRLRAFDPSLAVQAGAG